MIRPSVEVLNLFQFPRNVAAVLEAVVQDVDFTRWHFPIWTIIRWRTYPGVWNEGEMIVATHMEVPCLLNPGQRFKGAQEFTVSVEVLHTLTDKDLRELIVDIIHRGVQDVILHELDETFWVNKKRLNPPHRGKLDAALHGETNWKPRT